MARRPIEIQPGKFILLAMDDSAPLRGRFWAILSARLVDNVSGEPVRRPVTVTVTEPGFSTRLLNDGWIGLVGIPLNVFPALRNQNYTVHLTIRAEGYTPANINFVIGDDQRAIAGAVAPIAGDITVTLNRSAGLRVAETLLISPAGPGQETAVIQSLGPGANEVTLDMGLVAGHALGDPVFREDFAPVYLGDISLIPV